MGGECDIFASGGVRFSKIISLDICNSCRKKQNHIDDKRDIEKQLMLCQSGLGKTIDDLWS